MEFQVKETRIAHDWETSEWWPEECGVVTTNDAVEIVEAEIEAGYHKTTDPNGIIKLEIYEINENGELLNDVTTVNMNYQPVRTKTPINP